jgi:hypothetical protein
MTKMRAAFVCGAICLCAGCRPAAGRDGQDVAGKSAVAPLATYRLDAGAGDQIVDASGHGNNGNTVGGATWTRHGIDGSALLFNGLNRISVPSRASLDLHGPFSISVWIKGQASRLRIVEGFKDFRGPSFQVCGDTIYLVTNDEDSPYASGAAARDKDYDSWKDEYHLWTGTADISLTGWKYSQEPTDSSGIEPKLQVVGSTIHYEYFGQDRNGQFQIWTAQSKLDGTDWRTTQRTTAGPGYAVEQDDNIQVAGGRVYIGYPAKDSNGIWQLWTGSYAVDGSHYRALQRTTDHGWIPSLQVYGGKVYYLYIRNVAGNSYAKPYEVYFASSELDGTDWKVIKKIADDNWALGTGAGAFQIHKGQVYLSFPLLDSSGWTHLFTGRMALDGSHMEVRQRTFKKGYSGTPRGSLQVVGNKVYYVFGTLPTKRKWPSWDDFLKRSGTLGYELWTAESDLDGQNWQATLRAKGPPDYAYSYKGVQVVGAKIYVETMRLHAGGKLQEALGVAGANIVSKGDAFGIGVTEEGQARAFINAGADYKFHGEAPIDTAGAVADAAIDAEWHHVVATYDQHLLRLYVDGIARATTRYEGLPNSNPFPILIGDGFQGTIDDIAIYGQPLSASDVQNLYQSRMSSRSSEEFSKPPSQPH